MTNNTFVWKVIEKKKRVIVDIREFNKITQFDAYFMQLQSNLIFVVIECIYINIFDCTSFFHQWLMKIVDRHKLIVVTHRDNEQWNVTVMSFRNSSTYVQRQINRVLRVFRAFVKTYVNDIVVFNHSLKKHLRHLIQVFALFDKLNIALKSSKTYLNYLTISLLDQKINRFELFTVTKKLVAILRLKFSTILKDFETYLRLTEWLRDYVSFYAQKADVLRKRKTMLLKVFSFNKEKVRKNFSRRTFVHDSIDFERNSYHQLQNFFARSSWLIHQNFNRVLYADVDESRKKLQIMIYHLKSDKDDKSIIETSDKSISLSDKIESSSSSKRKNVKFIMFLSRMLTSTKKKYWFTELEMTKLVWLIKRIRHLIEISKHVIIIYTNHVVNSSIARQTKLTSNSVDKLNMKLMRVSAYLSQFRLNVRYKSDKSHIISNVLSRLSINNCLLNDKHDVLNIENFHTDMQNFENDYVYVYNCELIEMSTVFKKKLQVDYKVDKAWIKILIMLESLNERVTQKHKKSNLKKSFDTQLSTIMSAELTSSLIASFAIDAIEFDFIDSSESFDKQKSFDSVAENLSQTSRISVTSKSLSQIEENIDNVTESLSRIVRSTSIMISKNLLQISRIDIDFQLIDDLIYHIHENNDYDIDESRLCISKNCQKEIFKIAHDDNAHVDHHRVYRRLIEIVYMFDMSRKLCLYLRHCLACQLNQIKRHNSYEKLTSIFTSTLSFHIIAMNYILTLFEMKDLDVMLIMTNKVTRQLQLSVDKFIWSASQWVEQIVDRLQIIDWDVSKAIIFDRDRKFTFEFWTTFFIRMNTNFLMSSAYHSQIDDLSERFNQIVKITLRYLISKNFDVNWIKTLSTLQALLNNLSNVTIDRSLNEIVYEFKSRDVLAALTRKVASITDLDFERYRHQKKIVNVTSYAMTKIKILYDFRHTLLLLNSDDKAFLRLNKKYILFDKSNVKLSNQRCESFLIKRRVDRLAYELDLSSRWQIHSVISIMQLESTFKKVDLFDKFKPNYFDAVKIADMSNTVWEKNYEMKKIVDKRIRTYDKISVTQYLVRWLEYESIYDEWKFISILIEFIELIENYERSLQKSFDTDQLVVTVIKTIKISFTSIDAIDSVKKSFANLLKRRDRSSDNKSMSTKSFHDSKFIRRRSERSSDKKQSSIKRVQSNKSSESHISRQVLTLSFSEESHYYYYWENCRKNRTWKKLNWLWVLLTWLLKLLTWLLRLLICLARTFRSLFIRWHVVMNIKHWQIFWSILNCESLSQIDLKSYRICISLLTYSWQFRRS